MTDRNIKPRNRSSQDQTNLPEWLDEEALKALGAKRQEQQNAYNSENKQLIERLIHHVRTI
ncbi:MAG TPA: hypothetical protein VJ768_09860 [Anaerolineales bacterium]|nr:hypothetical protein [Anaerolineales bacterium]